MATPGSTKYAFISADEIDEYRQNGLTEDRIRLINEKRQERAAELKRNYNQEDYPYITKEQYDQLVAQGATRTKLESLNQQQGEELRKFRSNMTIDPSSSNTAPQGRGHVLKRDLRIVLFGLSGEGLSATGDTILGRKLFSGMSSSKSVEHGIQKDGRKITVSKISFSEDDIDDPGRMIKEAPDAFLLIVNISNHRDLKTQAKLWQNIKTYNKNIVARCILVLTHADLSFRGGDSLSSIYANYIDEKNAVPFGAVMRDLHPRIIALNNVSQSQQKMHVQQDQIMLMIDGVSQVTSHTPRKYEFISADEIDEYRQNGLTEDSIGLINEKRQKRAAELKRSYNPYDFPYITKEQYEQQVAQGATRTKLESLNRQQGEELRKFRSNMTIDPSSSNTAPQGRGPVPKRDLRIVLFGLSGEGLSATGNTILGQKIFSVRSSSKSAEHGIQKDGREITVSKISFSEEDIDDPGRKIEKATDVLGVDAFLLIVNISNHRDLKSQAKLWQNIKTYNKNIVDRCILVLTHADLSFRGGDSLSSIYADYIDEKNAVPFGAVMRDLHPRIVALNNLSQSQQEMHVQQEQIMLMIEGMAPSQHAQIIARPPKRSWCCLL